MSAAQHQACLLLGSNIDPEANIRKAIELLRQRFSIERVSAAWETPAWGTHGPNFINAAVLIHTSLPGWQLKEQIRRIEAQLGRVRSADKFAPRTIDIDIVAWDADVFESSLWKRAYLAVPVAEILPFYRSDDTGEYLEQAAQRLIRTAPIWSRPEVLGRSEAAQISVRNF